MIVSMNKLSVLIYHKEKENFLKSLQKMGIIHIVENTEVEQPEAVSESYRQAGAVSRSCERVIQALVKIKKEKKLQVKQEKGLELSGDKIDDILNRYGKLEERKENLQQTLADANKDIGQLQPWGNFDPDLFDQLREKGVNLRCFEIAARKYANLDLDDFYVSEVGGDKNTIRFVVFQRERTFEANEANEVNLPRKSLEKLHREVARLEAEIGEVDKSFEKMTVYLDILNEYKVANDNVAAYAEADVSLAREVDGKVFSLTGWFPTEREKIVNDFLSDYTCYFRIEKPEVDDNVPILLRNNWFSRLFEPITEIYSLPSYREIDPTPFFAPFFAVYFGLCLGDLGYGAMTFAIAAFAFLKGPKQFRNFYIIGMILGGMTMASGIALNSFFGQSIFYLQGNREFFFRSETGAIMSFLGSFVGPDRITLFPAMGFAIVLGIVQVLLGIFLQCVNRIRQNGIIWGIHPASFFIMICGILLTIGHGGSDSGFKGITGIDISTYSLGGLNIGSWLTVTSPNFGIFLVISGLVLMFLFNNPDKRVFVRPLMGLWELYGFATAIIGDILSYLRLFALGLASGLLGNAFNGIAFGFMESGIFPGIIATVALLVFAHALNFGLAILGSFVHPLRLTFVEFYKNLDFEGGGSAYTPFAVQKNSTV